MKRKYNLIFYSLLLLITLSTCYDEEHCEFVKFENAKIEYGSNLEIESNLFEARFNCSKDETCKAIFQTYDNNSFFTRSDENDIEYLAYSENIDDTVWIKTCNNEPTFRKINVPFSTPYFEPVMQGSNISLLKELSDLELRIFDNGLKRHREIKSSDDATEDNFMLGEYVINVKKINVQRKKSLEKSIKSWCTYSECEISPRTYFQEVTPEFALLAYTDNDGYGHVVVLGKNRKVKETIYPKVDGKSGIVSGVYGFLDGRFAVTVYLDDENYLNRRMYLQLYRTDFSMEWSTHLHSAIGAPDRNVGDSRLSYGDGYFAIYFTVYGVSNFANGTNGEQLSFVNEQGKLMTSSYKLPRQTFVESGYRWGCSHSLGQLVDFHPSEYQFATICTSDLYPKGISIGEPNTGALLFDAKANGRGYTSAQIGQLAAGNFGWKLLFNAMDFDCCEGNGVGFISIYNEIDDITGKQSFDDVVWLTDTRGMYERDPVMARYFPDGTEEQEKERYLVGWYNARDDDYYLATVDTFGSILQSPVATSTLNGTKIRCRGNCVAWGNRDDSFNTLSDGSIGWILAYPESKQIWMYEVSSTDLKSRTQWSLWSGWAMCSKSCGGGKTERIRTCLNESANKEQNCEGIAQETKDCNTANCTVPVVCTFTKIPETDQLIGTLFINQAVQFAYSEIEAKEKCFQFRDICWGYGEEIVNGFLFYVLKTEQITIPPENITEGFNTTAGHAMNCTERPGWSKWSTWYSCSTTCGGGSRYRTRFCDGSEKGSPVCQGLDIQIGACNLGKCPSWNEWSLWSECSQTCDEGVQNRNRQCVGDYPEACGDLKGPESEQRPCTKGICPYWTQWTEWSSCDKTCGQGTRFRTRDCRGDFDCSSLEEPLEVESCNLGVCQFWYDWSQWSGCSVTCESNGIRQRTRRCGGDFPKLCDRDSFEETETCSVDNECPRWTTWSEWSDCSATCDIGQRRRTQSCAAKILETCTKPGAAVNSTNTTYVIKRDFLKNLFLKIDAKNCTFGVCSSWDQWGNWETCSATCGNGTQLRSRQCYGDFPKMCASTGKSVEYQVCNPGTCGVWQDWSQWSDCSATCGLGTWTRLRKCIGDFKETCVGPDKDTRPCDVGDCIPECHPRPCNNKGQCRSNEYLARRYNCKCPGGWIGKHCDYEGPGIQCETDGVKIEIDRRVLSDELLPDDPKYVALSGFSDVSECSAVPLTTSKEIDVFSLTVPSPIDLSCGSEMEITDDEIRIRNRVTWKAVDDNIQAEVILLDFTCAYKSTIDTSVVDTFTGGPLTITSFKRSREIVNGSANFRVMINLFRDSKYRLPLAADFGTLMHVAEGQIVYVSVSLSESSIADDVGIYLVMNTCFVTASADNNRSTTQEQKPLLYLLKNRCPVSPFVRVISNGEGKSGKLSVRVFGWSGKNLKTKNLYLHCTVEICQDQINKCKPVCESRLRRKRFIEENILLIQKGNKANIPSSGELLHRDASKPYPSVVKKVDIGEPEISLVMKGRINFDIKYMVSAGPILVESETQGELSRQTRDVMMEKYDKISEDETKYSHVSQSKIPHASNFVTLFEKYFISSVILLSLVFWYLRRKLSKFFLTSLNKNLNCCKHDHNEQILKG
uniref:uncharacterized protein LOC120327756 n=1 Tax=Styela clava TaxID=7725 RepID=UPI001939E6B2|nr:uncharacterized protein LOC120327756 [Styela clava]